MTWRKPVIWQTEQLQSSAGTGSEGNSASNRISPQWQPPVTFMRLPSTKKGAAGKATPFGEQS